MQSGLEKYLESFMGWADDQGQIMEELAAKVESSTELRKRITDLEMEVEALKDLLYTSK